MPTTKKRVQRCWPATLNVRRDFLKPRDYAHRRDGGSAKQLLSRAVQKAESLMRYHAELSSDVWSTVIGDEEPQLPNRAEDMLNVLLSDKGLALSERGVWLTRMKGSQSFTDLECARAVATLTSCIARERQDTPHTIPLHRALRALCAARDVIEGRPV